MRILRSIAAAGGAPGALAGCAVAIGNFDGVHLGHRALFALARERAAGRGAPAAALTFHPHPVRVLRPGLLPPCLTPLPRKLELIAGCGLQAAVVQPFDQGYAASSAADFVARDLAGHLQASEVIVGPDFTAGRTRTRVEGLRALLAERGIRLSVVDPVTSDGLVVSSTKIRELLLEGNVAAAAELLARPHDVDGVVVRGDGRGRALGFATANVRTDAMLPANGVYAVRALVGPPDPGAAARAAAAPDEPQAVREARRAAELLAAAEAAGAWPEGAVALGGVCNVGVKPTVQEGGPAAAEVHLFGHGGEDLYGAPIRVAFVARLREERRFPSLDALRAQIAADAGSARAILAASPAISQR